MKMISKSEISSILIALLLAIAGCTGDVQVETSEDSTFVDSTPDDEGSRPSSPAPDTIRDTTVVIDTVVVPGKPAPDKPGKPTESRNIRVTAPMPGQEVAGSGFMLTGTARTFENAVSYRVVANNGRKLKEGFMTAVGDMGNFNPYTTTVEIGSNYTGPARLEVFQGSAKDGSEIDKVIVPITITRSPTTGRTELRIFFPNAGRGSGDDCSKVFAVTRRVAGTPAVAQAALNELLQGPDSRERNRGFATEIPNGTRLRDITINNGVARADFSAELNSAAGSCRVASIRAQIEQTLRQFSSVKSVVISVEGNSSAVLQP
jgi:hypothetical protein